MKLITFTAAGCATWVAIMFSGLFFQINTGNYGDQTREIIRHTSREEVKTIRGDRQVYRKQKANTEVPAEKWQSYVHPGEAGFNPGKLKEILDSFPSVNGNTFMVVYRGKILASKGDITRKWMMHSMRKAVMNAVYGAYIHQIDTLATLRSMQINDVKNPLTETEQAAKVIDLLGARSGIYLPSAYMPENMKQQLPIRGTAKPGEKWFYNNWDFNTLATIFKKQTGVDFFKGFQTKIAKPLQLEDYEITDDYYKYEPQNSEHPAYLMKLSTRDLARIGLLYLRNGRWNGKKLLPASWIAASTNSRSNDVTDDFGARGGFGLMWWVSEGYKGNRMYFTSGLGGHRMFIFPDMDMVVVIRPNTYQPGQGITDAKINQLLTGLIASVDPTQASDTKPKIQIAQDVPTARSMKSAIIADHLVKSYQHPQLGKFEVKKLQDVFVCDAGIGYYRIYQTGQGGYWLSDMELPFEFQSAGLTQKKSGTAEIIMSKNRKMEKVILYY